MYLGHDSAYVAKLWNEMKENTGIMNNEENPNLWHDVYWAYLALIDPSEAIELYDSYPDRELKFGISDAQTYHWLHALNALGRVDATITANYPIAMAFKQNGEITYVAHNYSKDTITVKFSSGYELVVPANKLVTSRDIDISGVLSSSFDQAFPGGSVQLSLEVSDGTPTKIEFMDGDELLGEDTTGPWSWKAENLSLGIHNLYARIYIDDKFNVSNTVNVIVGSQIPYGGTAWPIPGIIESGKYDTFEGGKGQNISYLDISPGNSGNFRPDESVDATLSSSQGAFVHHISANEWLEYTVNVEQSGLYSLALSYASGNSSGGGPFNLLIDGKAVVSGVTVASTSSTSWDVWSAKTLTEIPLVEGEHILRLEFTRGEFNPGKMTFTRTGEIPYTYPIASAGPDIKVLWPLSTAVLNGTASSESGDRSLDYKWMQVYGPSIAEFSDISIPEPGISGLVEGMYRFKLIVTNPDLRTSEDEVMVAVSKTENIAPYISLTSPSKDVSYPEGEEITLTAVASDFDGNIQQVEFYQNDSLISADTSKPYSVNWTEAAGEYVITAKAVDNEGGVSVSQARKVTFLPVFSCLGFSSAAQNGTFSVGYKYTFETIGSDVRITFELYDDQPGLIAYLWMESPFEEKDMKDIGDKKFSTILSNQKPGSTISVACKFAYSGGFSATKYISYVVGDDCADDNQIPVDFTATLGEVTPTSIQLLLNAVDNSGTIIYNITRGGSKKTITANSGVLTSYVVTALNPNTNYSFSIEAFDITGNAAISNPVSLSVKTLVSTNTACKGESSQASVGSFETGYNYEFLTSGKNVIVNFELLDNKSGVIAYLWNTTSGFTETDMTNAGGKKFSITLPNQTPGSVLKLACKFAFAGGLSVTKTYSYTVGDHCFPTEVKPNMETGAVLYPNPVKDILKLKMNSLPDANEELFLTVYDNRGKILKTIITRGSEDISIDLSGFTEGMYFIKAQTELNVFVWKVIKK